MSGVELSIEIQQVIIEASYTGINSEVETRILFKIYKWFLILSFSFHKCVHISPTGMMLNAHSVSYML